MTITAIDGFSITPSGSVVLANGTVSLASDGVTLTYDPLANFNGLTTLNYTVSDGSLTDTATVAIDFVAVNDAPVAVDDGPVVLVEDSSVLFDPVVNNDSDVEGDTLTITAIDGQAIGIGGSVTVPNGTIMLGADGRTIRFTPSPDFNGPSIVTYTVSDGQEDTDAVVTFDVTPVDDPVTVATIPPDVIFDDGSPVSLPMAGFFNDPDGDVLTYSATGLPIGLTIDAVTGIISGALDPSASQTSPYAITVTVDDGLSSTVSTGFTLDAVNTVPVASPAQTVTIDDGSMLSIDANALFADADGDALTFSINPIPSWLTFNAATGILTGTAPSDASATGPFTVTVAANDAEGGVATIDITIDPQNPAPIATRTIPDLFVAEEEAVDIDLNGLFIDGGLDTDPVTISVTGLPEGVTFDPLTGLISGVTVDGSGSATPYLVTVRADDGQGGITTYSFSIRVGNPSFIEDNIPFNGLTDTESDNSGDDEEITGEVIQTVAELSSLNGIGELLEDDGIVLSAVEGVQSLQQATGSGSSGSDGGLISSLAQLSELQGWINESNWINEGDWNVETSHPFASLMDEGPMTDQPPEIRTYADESMPLLQLVASKRNGIYILELRNGLNLLRDGKLIEMDLTLDNGDPLPNWIDFVRPGFATANPPAGTESIDIRMRAVLDSGTTVEKLIHIDFAILLDAPEPARIPPAPAPDAEPVAEEVVFTP